MINKSLPLIDLHRHLDGNIRAETIWQLAQENNIKLPENTLVRFLPHVTITQNEPDLMSFLKKLDWGVAVIKTLDDCKRIAYENVEDVFNAGIDYAELRFSPYYIAKTHKLPTQDVVAAIIDGVNAGCADFNVQINLIGILSRTFGVKQCQHELESLLAHKERLVAIDLAGDEYNYPGHLFEKHFKQVADAGLNITIHAGEAAGSESVWHAINKLGASRIGHGVVSYKDKELMDFMRINNVGIESCLTSNIQTGTVKLLAEHPIQIFLRNEMLVCLNTDDPAVEGIELAHEYHLAYNTFDFSKFEMSRLQENALTMSFLSSNQKQELTKKIK